jgi:predicted AlkP superfamily phosphohydrolase/phosphomutase
LYADKLNNKEQGTAHLKKASTLWKELTEKHPNHIDFQNNYTWVVDKLKSLEET